MSFLPTSPKKGTRLENWDSATTLTSLFRFQATGIFGRNKMTSSSSDMPMLHMQHGDFKVGLHTIKYGHPAQDLHNRPLKRRT